MKRREFIRLTGIGAVSTVAIVSSCGKQSEIPAEMLLPKDLSAICTTKEINQIGQNYLQTFPSENDPDKLYDLIAGEAKTTGAIGEMIQSRIAEDYKTDQTVIIDGWVLSVTEARQCALFNLHGGNI